MTRALKIAISALVLSVLGGAGFFLLASSKSTSREVPVRKTTYGKEFASTEKDTFTVMTYNLGASGKMAVDVPQADPDSGISPHVDSATKLIRQADPDIVGLQNVDFRTTGPDAPPQLEPIATRLGIPEVLQSPGRDRGILPWTSSGRSGQAMLSRFPIRRYLGKGLEQPFWQAPFGTDSFVQIAALDIGGWPLIVMNVHLNKFDPETREKQVLTIIKLYGRLAKQPFPVLVIGTFNSLMPAAAPSIGTEAMGLLLERTNLSPALSSEAAQVTGKSVATYPADRPRRKIDYILHNQNYIIPTSAEVLCGHRPAGHCAVTMSFLLPRPKDKLREKRIPDDRLPSLDHLLGETERK